MCKAGVVPDIKPGVQVNEAKDNSSVISSLVQDSVQTYIDITVTSSAALAIGFFILLIAILVLHQLSKRHHRTHTERLHTLARLTGFGADNLATETV